jgi:hypothetical protein
MARLCSTRADSQPFSPSAAQASNPMRSPMRMPPTRIGSRHCSPRLRLRAIVQLLGDPDRGPSYPLMCVHFFFMANVALLSASAEPCADEPPTRLGLTFNGCSRSRRYVGGACVHSKSNIRPRYECAHRPPGAALRTSVISLNIKCEPPSRRCASMRVDFATMHLRDEVLAFKSQSSRASSLRSHAGISHAYDHSLSALASRAVRALLGRARAARQARWRALALRHLACRALRRSAGGRA